MAATILLLCLLTADYFLYPGMVHPSAPTGNRGENGLWLRYSWYFGKQNRNDMDTLAIRLREEQIRYAYFHVRSVGCEGSLRYRYPKQARTLTDYFHKNSPGVKLFAWVYAGNRNGLGKVNLDISTVRRKMVQDALWLTTVCGFDGVQWYYEICSDGDPGFLALMRETHAVLPKGKLLSVATPMYSVVPIARLGWSESYFRNVAGSSDQVCVMVYDSAMYLPRAYVALGRSQVVHATNAVAASNPKCRVLIGIPTYCDATLSHNPKAENLAMGLKFVREGLADPRSDQKTFAGVSIFADYTTDENEWRTYKNWWLDEK